MTLEEQSRLSYYKEISSFSTHHNVSLVQHIETKHIYVKKTQDVYNKAVYQTLIQLNDRHIPRIYECIEDGGQLTIIEEYVQGESLAEHLQKYGVYTEQEVVYIIQTICQVLDVLHHLHPPIIHRDLKPENIIISSDGVLKMIDFNAAKQFTSNQDTDTVLIGTREFAAPEQYGFSQSDARTDIYALGVMMNILLTGDYPKERIYQNEESQAKYAGGTLTEIIQKCIAFSPDMRYQDIRELRRALSVVHGTEEDTVDKKDKKEIDEKPVLEQKHPLFPPGFRSGHLWKMIVGALGYFFIFWLCLTMKFTDTNHVVMTGLALWVNRICVLIGMLFTVVMLFNYGNIQSYLPFPKSKKLRLPVSVLYSAIGFIIMAAICSVFA